MASKSTPWINTMPNLVVKIVGSRQVRYFAEESNEAMVVNQEMTEKVQSAVVEDVPVHIGKPTISGRPFLNKALDEDTRVHRELQQIGYRQCVTAPCGDRSLSYIHLKKNLSATTNLQRAATRQGGQEEGELKDVELEEEVWWRAFQAIGEELWGWGDSSTALANIERDVLELDTSRTGAIHQSQLTYVFLRNEVPLKLPTLGRLLQLFSKETCSNEVLYKELLHFLSNFADSDQKMKTDGSNQPQSRASESVCDDSSSPLINVRTDENWAKRFQKMERALDMCDTQNTGFLDKDKARRLLQNYNVILDLHLSPLKIAEATRTTRSEGKIHLASALRYLKGL